MFPMEAGISYQTHNDMPKCTEGNLSETTPLIVHISNFSFSEAASVKLPPGESLVMQLCAEYLTDGFADRFVYVYNRMEFVKYDVEDRCEGAE
jgi:hypothetical protein